jgi:hypothetical protein
MQTDVSEVDTTFITLMQAICISETSVCINKTKRYCIPEGCPSSSDFDLRAGGRNWKPSIVIDGYICLKSLYQLRRPYSIELNGKLVINSVG